MLLASVATTYRQRILYCSAGWCFAFLLELLEATIYHNRIEWGDLLVDTLGLATGLALWARAHRPRLY